MVAAAPVAVALGGPGWPAGTVVTAAHGLLWLRGLLLDDVNAIEHEHHDGEREGEHHAFFLVKVHRA